jgi:hypothetical protein
MRFEEFTIEEQEKLEKIAKEYQAEYQLVKEMMDYRKCFMCKTEFPDKIFHKFIYKDNVPVGFLPTPEFLFHAKTTHGLFLEFFEKFFSYIYDENYDV